MSTARLQYSWLVADIHEDTGCPDLGIPACLRCPLPACRFDLPHKRAKVLLRAARLRELLSQGLSIETVAERMGVSNRTLFRLKVTLEQLEGA